MDFREFNGVYSNSSFGHSRRKIREKSAPLANFRRLHTRRTIAPKQVDSLNILRPSQQEYHATSLQPTPQVNRPPNSPCVSTPCRSPYKPTGFGKLTFQLDQKRSLSALCCRFKSNSPNPPPFRQLHPEQRTIPNEDSATSRSLGDHSCVCSPSCCWAPASPVSPTGRDYRMPSRAGSRANCQLSSANHPQPRKHPNPP